MNNRNPLIMMSRFLSRKMVRVAIAKAKNKSSLDTVKLLRALGAI